MIGCKVTIEQSLSTAYRAFLVFAALLFIGQEVYGFWALELDGAPDSLRGVSFGDCMGWAAPSRIKFLHGVYERPYVDLPFQVVTPFYSLLTWIGFELFGLTLTGLRFFSYVAMIVVKLGFIWLIWRHLGAKYFPWVILFVSVYSPFLAFSQIGNPEVVQMALLTITMLLLAKAEKVRSTKLYFLCGIVLGVTIVYKPHLFLMPLYPAIFFIVRYFWNQEIPRSLKIHLADCLSLYSGLILFLAAYSLAWLLPNLSDFIHFSLLDMGYMPAINTLSILTHLLDILMFLTPNSEVFFNPNAIWLMGSVIFVMLLMLARRQQVSHWDMIALSYIIYTFFQLAYTYSQGGGFYRIFTLLPLGCYAFFRSLDFAIRHREVFGETRPSFLRWLIISYCVYILLFKVLLLFSFPGNFAMTASAIAAIVLAWGFYYLSRSHSRTFSIVIITFLAACSFGFWQHSYNHFTNHQTIIRDTSITLNKLGDAKAFGLYQYSLYNQIDDIYLGSFASSSQPTDFKWASSQGLTMEELARKYRFRSVWALAIWVTGLLQPDIYSRWRLPPDYRSKFQSGVFITPAPSSNTPSSRYLLVGAMRPEVYMIQGWPQFLARYGNKVPITQEFMDITTRANYKKKPKTLKIYKVLAWENNPGGPK